MGMGWEGKGKEGGMGSTFRVCGPGLQRSRKARSAITRVA